MALLWINRWIGHVTRTKHRDTRLEYRASESKSVKWVERKGLACKTLSRNFQRTCRCSHHHEAPYSGRSKSLQQTTGAILTTTIKESAWACEGMHGMAIMMQCNLTKLSGIGIPTHTYSSSCFTTRQFKGWLAWQRQGIGELLKIKWSGVTIFDNTQILHMLLIRWYANYHGATWCKMQTIIWMLYSGSTYFSDRNSYIILFISSYSLEDMNLARLKHLQ
jgi:hypothetical protein